MHRILRTAVIGVGAMGRHHARVYAEMDDVQLAGVQDANAEAARRVAGATSSRAFRTLDALLAEKPDAVSVAIPTRGHADLVSHLLENGIDVLVEKPIAGTLRGATELIQAAEKTGQKLMVGHIERFNPVVQTLREAIDPETIIAINITRVGPRPPRIKDVGVIVDLAVHDIDLACHLTGRDVDDVYCVTSNGALDHEDTASILLRLNGGIAAQLTTNWVTPFKAREIQLVTDSTFYRADLITRQVQAFSRQGDDGTYAVSDLHVPNGEPLKAELQAFLAAVRGDIPVPVTAHDGRRALETAIRASAYKHTRLSKAA